MAFGPESPYPSGRGRASEGTSTALSPRTLGCAAGVMWVVTGNRQKNAVSGSSRCSSPQVIQCALLPRRGKVFPARLVVNQVDDEVPHDRTPLFDPWMLIAAIRFPASSRDHENGFVIATEWFRGHWTMKQLHGFAITQFGRLHCLRMVQSTTRPSGI